MRPLKVAVLGCGSVGSQVVRLLILRDSYADCMVPFLTGCAICHLAFVKGEVQS